MHKKYEQSQIAPEQQSCSAYMSNRRLLIIAPHQSRETPFKSSSFIGGIYIESPDIRLSSI